MIRIAIYCPSFLIKIAGTTKVKLIAVICILIYSIAVASIDGDGGY